MAIYFFRTQNLFSILSTFIHSPNPILASHIRKIDFIDCHARFHSLAMTMIFLHLPTTFSRNDKKSMQNPQKNQHLLQKSTTPHKNSTFFLHFCYIFIYRYFHRFWQVCVGYFFCALSLWLLVSHLSILPFFFFLVSLCLAG